MLNVFAIQREFSCVKRARVDLLSPNQIREVIMDSDSEEDKSYTSQESEDEEQPRPPSRRSSFSEPPSPDYSNSSEDGNVGGQHPQPCKWTLPPKPRRPVVTVTYFFLHVVGRKSHTEIFDSPLSKRYWHGMGKSHDHPCL